MRFSALTALWIVQETIELERKNELCKKIPVSRLELGMVMPG